MRTRVKICGITRPDDARSAARAGADAIGLVFYRASPRCVANERARAIIAATPPFVKIVGVFFDPGAEELAEVCRTVPLDCVQLHGDESPDRCRSGGLPYIKGIRMRDNVNVEAVAANFPDAQGFLVDTYSPTAPGGTGESFPWTRLTHGFGGLPVILAGGLSVQNVGAAIAKIRPFAVDVSSGVESEKGIKDAQKLQDFIAAVHRADDALQNRMTQ